MAYETPWGSVTDEMPEQAHYSFDSVFFAGMTNYNDGCELPEGGTGNVNLWVKPDGSVLFNSVNSGEEIGGFQFNILGATVTNASGGSAAEAGLYITTAPHMVLAFSFDGSTVSEGCGTLVNIDIEGEIRSDSYNMTDLVFSDQEGEALGINAIQTTIGPNDWVGAFKGDVCVGAQQWDRDLCQGGVCSVRVGGWNSLMTDLTEGYMLAGDIPTFKIYDNTRDAYFNASVSEPVDPWAKNANFNYASLTAAELTVIYNLHQYNNFISFPLTLEDTSLDAVFGATHDITNLASTSTSASWNGTAWEGSITNIDPKKGYWVRASKDTLIELSGSFLPNPTYDMQEFNNLISYPGHESVKLQDAFPHGVLQDENSGASGLYSFIGEATSAVYREGIYGVDFDGYAKFKGVGGRITNTADATRQAFTYSFWARSSKDKELVVFSHGDEDLGSFVLGSGYGGPQLRMRGNIWYTWDIEPNDDNSVQYDGNWHHYVVSFTNVDIDESELWVDNVPASMKNNAGASYFYEWTTGLTIGSAGASGSLPSSGNWSNDFDGDIKEFAWFDTLLSGTEVATIWNGGTPNDISGMANLQGYWKLDANADDSSGNDFHGNVDQTNVVTGGWMGSLMYLQPKRCYWMRSHNAFSFQYNLETTAQCSQLQYTNEAGCTGAGFEWVELLVPITGG